MGKDEDFFPDATQRYMCPITISCNECTYVQKHINENDEKIDPPADSEQTFSSSYFMKEPNYTEESIEASLNEINMERIQDKGEIIPSQKQDDKKITIDEEEVASSLDGTHPDDMEEGVSETKYDKNEKIYEGKDEKCSDVPSPVDMKEDVS